MLAAGRILASDGAVLAATHGNSRVYPLGESLAQTLGYVSSRYGTSGIEDAYDRALTPADTTGDPIAQLEEISASLQGKAMVSHGADIVTTIVPPIQEALWDRLSRHARAAGVVLDPRTGAVLALASVPSYDPNTVDRDFASLSTDAQSPLLDRAIDGLYPPGSTFKIFTASAALDAERSRWIHISRIRDISWSVTSRCTTMKVKEPPGTPILQPRSRVPAMSTSRRSRSRWATADIL